MKLARLLLAVSAFTFAPIALTAQATPAPASTTPAATTSTIPADQQATKEQIDHLFAVMHNHEMVDKMLSQMLGTIKQQINQQLRQTMQQNSATKMTPETMDKFQKIMDKYMDKAMTIISVDELLNDMGTVYQHHLSKSDVEAMTAFYQTPAGQHLLSEMPGIMKDYMAIMMPKMQEKQMVLLNEMSRDIKDLASQSTSEKSTPAK